MGEMRNTPALDILGTRVHALTLQDAAERIVEAAAAGRQLTVFPRDAHGIVRSRSNAALARAMHVPTSSPLTECRLYGFNAWPGIAMRSGCTALISCTVSATSAAPTAYATQSSVVALE